MEKITIAATDGTGTFDVFLARARKSPAGVVVLIQEIFGINDSMRETARQVAEMDFHVLAPDLFWRLEPGVNITDKTDAEWKKALDLMNRFDQAKGVEDLKATLDYGRTMEGSDSKVGTMGYCLGGRLAMMMALESD
ncbi:MAG TPA: dienelactone hydrolase family protein, partial [Acetobacteraceae bacterium]|nr:dienelactone hydrolase family protein [Acetobacteraceae bacterium]